MCWGCVEYDDWHCNVLNLRSVLSLVCVAEDDRRFVLFNVAAKGFNSIDEKDLVGLHLAMSWFHNFEAKCVSCPVIALFWMLVFPRARAWTRLWGWSCCIKAFMGKYLWALHFMYVYGEKFQPDAWAEMAQSSTFFMLMVWICTQGWCAFCCSAQCWRFWISTLNIFHADGLDLHTGVVCLLLFSTVLKVLDFHTFVVYFLISTLHSCNAVCCFPHMWCHSLVVHKWHESKYNNAHATNINTHMHMQHVFVYFVWWVIDCTYVTTCHTHIKCALCMYMMTHTFNVSVAIWCSNLGFQYCQCGHPKSISIKRMLPCQPMPLSLRSWMQCLCGICHLRHTQSW